MNTFLIKRFLLPNTFGFQECRKNLFLLLVSCFSHKCCVWSVHNCSSCNSTVCDVVKLNGLFGRDASSLVAFYASFHMTTIKWMLLKLFSDLFAIMILEMKRTTWKTNCPVRSSYVPTNPPPSLYPGLSVRMSPSSSHPALTPIKSTLPPMEALLSVLSVFWSPSCPPWTSSFVACRCLQSPAAQVKPLPQGTWVCSR